MIIDSMSHIRDGNRVLIKAADAKFSDDPLFATARIEESWMEARLLVGDDGTEYRRASIGFETGTGQDVRRFFLSWTLPMPDLPDPEIIGFYHQVKNICQIVERSERRLLPALFYVDEVRTDYAYARLVSSLAACSHTQLAEDEDLEAIHGHVVVSTYTTLIPISDLPCGTTANSLLLGADMSCDLLLAGDEEPERQITHLLSPVLLKAGVPFDEVARYVPFQGIPEDYLNSVFDVLSHPPAFDTATVDDHQHELRKAAAVHQPNRALILVIDEDGKSTHHSCLATTGVRLFGIDDVTDFFWSHEQQPGIWVYDNAEVHSGWTNTDCGPEYDSEIDGDYIPATEADLEQFGHTLESVGEILIEHLSSTKEIDGLDLSVLTRNYLALAQAAAGTTPVPG